MAFSEPVVFLGGKFIPVHEAHVNLVDLAVVMGATVTDQLRTFRHLPFRLSDHVERFYRSSQFARITSPLSMQETTQAVESLIEQNASLIAPDEDLGVLLFLSPGQHPGYAAPGHAPSPTFCIHSFTLQFADWRPLFQTGAHVVTPPTRHVPPQCLEPKIKHRSRMHWWIAQQEAQLVDPHAIPLLLDVDGNVTETAGSNFVIVSGGSVISPSPRNILRGVSLVTLAELCASLGISFMERDFQLYEAIHADEAMLPTTPYCLAPATRINGLPIGNGKPGPVFERLLQAWSKLVGLDILQQINTQ